MRPVRKITAAEENFRTVQVGGLTTIKRDSIEPEPVGTIVLMPFRITGYDKDCDGSLMVRLEQIDKDGETSGWCPDRIGLYSDSALVVTQEELPLLFRKE